MDIRKNVFMVMGLVLSLALAFSLMSCATTDQMKMLEEQVQQASQDAKDAKASTQDCAQQAIRQMQPLCVLKMPRTQLLPRHKRLKIWPIKQKRSSTNR